MREMKLRLARYRDAAGYSKADVARALNVSRSTVSNWEDLRSEKKPTVDNLLALSALLRRTVSDILGQDDLFESEGRPARGAVPLVTVEQAAQDNLLMDLHIPGVCLRHLHCPYPHGPNAFALEVASDANQTPGADSLPTGSIAFFDPSQSASSGDMVLARLPSGTAVVRQLVIDGDQRFLRPLNPQFARTDGAFEVIARLIGDARPRPAPD